MKTKSLFFNGVVLCLIVFMISCSTDSPDCHECHIAFDGPNGEIEIEIGEFCRSALEEVEHPDYSHTLDEDVIIGNDTIPAGTYSNIHYEEHAH